ncbi:MAG: hypothetical protein OXG69_04510 [bacterium]|nr:hypothetical protein [bacterium]
MAGQETPHPPSRPWRVYFRKLLRKLPVALAAGAVGWIAAMPLVAAVTIGDMGLLWLVSGSLATLVLIGNTAAAAWLWRRRRRWPSTGR